VATWLVACAKHKLISLFASPDAYGKIMFGVVFRIRTRVADLCGWYRQQDEREAANAEISGSSHGEKDEPNTSASSVKINYNSDGWPLSFRPAGSPAGTWPHTPWWHCACPQSIFLPVVSMGSRRRCLNHRST
jgi:hypothetical protein